MQWALRSIVAATLLAAVAACAGSDSPTALAASVGRPQFAKAGGKFTFLDVVFPDGTTGIIAAGTKAVNKGTFTQCSYYSPDWEEYLGGFGDDTLAAADVENPDAVLAYCLSHFQDRS